MKIKKVFKLSIFMIICGVILVLIAFAIPGKRAFKGHEPKIPIEKLRVSIEDKLLPSPPKITTKDLPHGRVGIPYGVDIEAKGGSGNYNFYTTPGKLPKWLILDFKGIIGGIPADGKDGDYKFVVKVMDSKNNQAQKEFNLTIDPPEQGLVAWIKYPEKIVNAMCVFESKEKKYALYAGTGNEESGIWRSDGDDFIEFYSKKPPISYDGMPFCEYTHMLVFKDKLYIVENIYKGYYPDSSMIYSSENGLDVYPIPQSKDFGEPNNAGISAVAIFNGKLYVATRNSEDGAQIWRTYDGINWEKVYQYKLVSPGGAIMITSMIEFKDNLYATTYYNKILRFNGKDWKIMTVKAKNSFCVHTFLLEVFKEHLYLVDTHYPYEKSFSTKIFRSLDGIKWEEVFKFNTQEPRIKAVTKSDKRIYFGVCEGESLANEVIYFDGENWGTVPLMDSSIKYCEISSMAMFGNYIYIGLQPQGDGAASIYRIYENWIK